MPVRRSCTLVKTLLERRQFAKRRKWVQVGSERTESKVNNRRHTLSFGQIFLSIHCKMAPETELLLTLRVLEFSLNHDR